MDNRKKFAAPKRVKVSEMPLRDQDKRIRDQARRYIKEFENQGFVVPQNIKNELWDSEGNEINLGHVIGDRLRADKSRFSFSSLQAKAELNVNKANSRTLDKVKEEDGSVSYIPKSYKIEPTKIGLTMTGNFAKKLNKDLAHLEDLQKEGYEISKMNIGDDLAKFASRLSGELPQSGDDNKYYSIDSDWNGRNDTLFEHIKFKNVSLRGRENPLFMAQNIQELYERTPYLKEELQERFEEGWKNSSYYKNLKSVKDDMNKKYGVDISIDELAAFKYIMDTSAAWNIAKRNAADSKQVKRNWEELTKLVMNVAKVGSDSDFDTVKTMIDNEEDLEDIRDYVNNVIGSIV